MHRERGAVMVEMAIVLPIFILLLFGMLELGLAFKDKLAMTHAVNQATRDATVQGNDDAADIEILSAFEGGLAAAASIDSVLYVDIFKAADDGSPLEWDRYTLDDDGVPCRWDPCPDPTAVDSVVYGSPANYPPCARDTVFDSADGVDTIGVRVSYTHTWVSGVLGFSTSTWEETAQARMEPKRFGTVNPSC